MHVHGSSMNDTAVASTARLEGPEEEVPREERTSTIAHRAGAVAPTRTILAKLDLDEASAVLAIAERAFCVKSNPGQLLARLVPQFGRRDTAAREWLPHLVEEG
jgi:hypothetical protein